jgi:hypothetical protein
MDKPRENKYEPEHECYNEYDDHISDDLAKRNLYEPKLWAKGTNYNIKARTDLWIKIKFE